MKKIPTMFDHDWVYRNAFIVEQVKEARRALGKEDGDGDQA